MKRLSTVFRMDSLLQDALRICMYEILGASGSIVFLYFVPENVFTPGLSGQVLVNKRTCPS